MATKKLEETQAVLAKSGVSFDLGMLARVRLEAGGGQAVSKPIAARLVLLWNAALGVPDEEIPRVLVKKP